MKRYASSEREVAEADEKRDTVLEQDAMAAEQVRDARLTYHHLIMWRPIVLSSSFK